MTTFPELREALKACADAAEMPRGDVYQGIERLRAQRDTHETACEVSLHAAPAMLAHIDAQAAEIERLREVARAVIRDYPLGVAAIAARAALEQTGLDNARLTGPQRPAQE